MSAQLDFRLIKEVIDGNRNAQKALYDSYHVYLFGVASLYSDSKHEAEDILQEGFYRIFKDISSYSGRGDIRAWMRKVMVNSALMHIRKYRKIRFVGNWEDEKIKNMPNAVDFDAKARANSILTIIRSLPEPQRIIFSLKGIEGYSYKEISEKLDMNESTLRSHYLRARKNLQIVIQKELE